MDRPKRITKRQLEAALNVINALEMEALREMNNGLTDLHKYTAADQGRSLQTVKFLIRDLLK